MCIRDRGNGLTSVQEGAWRSEKLEKLFVYLAMNRNRGVCIEAVSYTHLDVYKRQQPYRQQKVPSQRFTQCFRE